jgi:hypothetical protein
LGIAAFTFASTAQTANSRRDSHIERDVPGYLKGVLVALANTFVVATFVAWGLDGGNLLETTFVISFIGLFPATVIGGLLGHHGETMQANRHGIQLGMIAVSCSVVVVLGLAVVVLRGTFELSWLALGSCVPTAANCAILERWTRDKSNVLPDAHVA